MSPNKLLKLIYIMSTVLLISAYTLGQGLTIGTGTIFSLGSATLSLSNNWSNSGTFTPGTGTVIFNGTDGSSQTITNSNGETFYNLTVNNSTAVVQLLNNISVANKLTISGGDLDLNGKTISLSATGTLIETAGNTIIGTSGTISISNSALNAPSSYNMGGLGAVITSSADLGSTTITRGNAVQTGNNNNSILRYFDISPTINTGLNATLVFYYDDSELNNLNESELELFKSTDNGTHWTQIGGTVDITNNTVTFAGIDGFSRWTLGSRLLPLPVEEVEAVLPTKFELFQNYPNPFNPSTNISFSILGESFVTLKIYDILGREVAQLINQRLKTGNYNYSFDTASGSRRITSGVYFYRLTAISKTGKFIQSKKMVLLR